MRVYKRIIIDQFKIRYPKSVKSLDLWVSVMERYDAKHFIELKNWFNSADVVSPYTVFDISGNNYRLIAVVVYKAQACTITEILTHKEYDKGGWKK